MRYTIFVLSLVLVSLSFAATNLLTNGGAETGNFTGWTVVDGGSGWTVVSSFLADDFNTTLYPIEGSYAFSSSYEWGTLSQEIDLVGKGYGTTYLDSAPNVSISAYVIGIWYTPDQYQVKVELRNASHNIITSFDTGVLNVTSSWQNISNTFADYGSGLRYIYFEQKGKDVEWWLNQYGSVFDNASVYLGYTDVSLNSPANGANLSNSGVTLNWTPQNFSADPTCNVTRNSSLIFSGACANNTACTTANATPDGAYSWSVTCYTGSEIAVSATRRFSVDTIWPAVSIQNPTNATYNTSDLALNFTATDQGSGVASCTYQLDSNAAVSGCTNTSLAALTGGAHAVRVNATDGAGNMNSTVVSFSVDTSAPSVSVQSPLNATYSAASVSLNYTVSESGSGTDKCWYALDGGNNTTLINCANRTVTPAGDGPHTITVYANDSAGNTGSAGVSFTFNSLKTNIQLAIRNQDVRPSYLAGISLDGDYVAFSPPFYFPGGIRQIISFGSTKSLCNYTGQLIYFDRVTLYYMQGNISGLAQSGSVPLVTKCS